MTEQPQQQPPKGCKPKECSIVDLCAEMKTGYLPPCAPSRPITPDYTNDKCGSDKCLAIINRKVEERTATIRNATLDKIHARYVDAYLNPDNYNEINAKEVYQFIESLRSKGGEQ